MTVLTAIVHRMDNSQGLILEKLRAMHRQHGRLAHHVKGLSTPATRKRSYAARRKLNLRPSAEPLTNPMRSSAPSTEAIFGSTRRPWRKRAASAAASSGVEALARAAMTAAVCAMSSVGNSGFGPVAGAASGVTVPTTRSSSSCAGCRPPTDRFRLDDT